MSQFFLKFILGLAVGFGLMACTDGGGGGATTAAPRAGWQSSSSSTSSTSASPTFEKYVGDNQIATTQIQNGYTIPQLTKALRTVSQILARRDPTADELSKVQTGGFQAYVAVVNTYLNTPDFQAIQLAYYRNLFGMSGKGTDGINYDEPANLATFLVYNNYDFRWALTADFCVDNNLNITTCSAFKTTTDTKAQAAGVLTTQAFLKKWAGPFNFGRYNRAYMAFACGDFRSIPDTHDPGMTEAEISKGVKDFRCNTPFSSSNPTGCSPICYTCHRNMNPRSAQFYAFDRKGFYNPTPNPDPAAGEITVTDIGTASTKADLLVGSVAPRFFGSPITNLRDLATRFSQGKEFRDCLAQRLSNQMFNRSPGDPMLPSMQDIRDHVNANGYRPKAILLEIATHPAFVLR